MPTVHSRFDSFSDYPLAEVPEAIRYVEDGRARGKVVVSVA